MICFGCHAFHGEPHKEWCRFTPSGLNYTHKWRHDGNKHWIEIRKKGENNVNPKNKQD